MLSVIIPAYNEEKNIMRIEKELIPFLKKLKTTYEIVIVDDGSYDKTAERAQELQKKHNEIVIIKHGSNKGLGAAVITGINAVKGETTIMLDSDFTFHPRDIPTLLDVYKRQNADCIIGSPYTTGGEVMEDVPFLRAILSKGINILYFIVFGTRIKSFSSIFRVYNTKYLKEMKLRSTGFTICAEILFRLIQKKTNIIEVPVSLGKRLYGKSKIKIFKETKNNVLFLIKVFLLRIWF